MKLFVLIIFLLFSVNNEAQTEFEAILKNASKINLPYTSISPSIDLENAKKVLHASDSLFIVTRLNRIEPQAINLYGNSPFGQIDCEETMHNSGLSDSNNCLKISEIKEIAILCFVKIYDRYLLHLELTEKGANGNLKGILVSMNGNGEVIDWFFSNGSANSGNPNGNVSRDFTIQQNATIDVEESTWGNNNISYSFKAKFDFEAGEFKLNTLSIKY